MNEHATDDQILRFLDGTLSPRELAATANHLADCPSCAAAASARYDVNAAAEAVRRDYGRAGTPGRRGRDARTPIAALLAAAAVLILVWLWPGTVPSPPDPHPEWRALTERALAAGRLEPPAILRELRPPAPSLRGPKHGALEVKLAPAGTVVEEERPRFRWDAIRGARGYTVLVFAGGKEVARGATSSNAWQPEVPLKRGVTYEWQVIAGDVVLPPALFRVLDAGAAAEITRARHERPGDALLLGVLYARAGVVDRAEESLRGFPSLRRSVLEWR